MADKKLYRKSRKAKGGKRVVKRRYPSNDKMFSSNLRGPFAKELYTRLSYTENVTLTATSGNLVQYKWILNSLYDVNSSGTGAQPTWFDNLCGASAPYHKYRVLGGTLEAQFINKNSSSGSVGDVAVMISNDAITLPTDMSSVINTTNVKSKIISVMDGRSGNVTIKYPFSCKKILAVKDLKDHEDTAALYNASPANQVWGYLNYQPMDLLTSAAIYCRVKINFIVQLYERQTPDQS